MAKSRKGREKRRYWNCLFCFGLSRDQQELNKYENNKLFGDGKLLKYIGRSKKWSGSGKTVPIGESTLSIVNSNTEIQVVAEAKIEKVLKKKTSKILAPLPTNRLVTTDKEMILQKSNSEKKFNKENSNSTTQEAWSNNYPLIKLSHSVSLPPTQRRTEKTAAAGGGSQEQKQLINELINGGGGATTGEFEPIVGALIIMVTLVVMIVWGKVCAILSTAAWFYFIPRLIKRTNNISEYSRDMKLKRNQIDLDSAEYKKKVVLQGFLERNQHV